MLLSGYSCTRKKQPMTVFEQIRISKTASGYQLAADQLIFSCVIGRSGLIAADQKTEGDGATPVGNWPVRGLYYRPDRVAEDLITDISQLPCRPITPQMGWVDDPASALYNRPVMLPCADRHEQLWREDGLYDLILPLGYNDGPARPGAGSAIFLHCAEPDTMATEGCVALARTDLLSLLPGLAPTTRLHLYP